MGRPAADLTRRLREAETLRNEVLEDLRDADDLLDVQHDLLGRLGVAVLLPLIATGDGDALGVAREILAVLRGWEAGRRKHLRALEALGEARMALGAVEEVVGGKGSPRFREALAGLREALGKEEGA
jgi:hypothetical protein